MYERGLVLLTATSRTFSTERPAFLQDASTLLLTSSRFLAMSTPASAGDSAVSLLIANEEEVKGRRKGLVLAVPDAVVTNDGTKYLRAVTLHIHRANEYVKQEKTR